MFRDVTKHKRADQEREQLVAALQQERAELQDTQRALQEKVSDLEAFHDVTVGRELKMMEMQKEIARLREENAALKQSRASLAFLVASPPPAILRVTVDRPPGSLLAK